MIAQDHLELRRTLGVRPDFRCDISHVAVGQWGMDILSVAKGDG